FMSVGERRLIVSGTHVKVPLDLLLASELTPADKIVWIICRIASAENDKSQCAPAQLADRARLVRSTVYQSLARLERAAWGSSCPSDRERSSRTGYWHVQAP